MVCGGGCRIGDGGAVVMYAWAVGGGPTLVGGGPAAVGGGPAPAAACCVSFLLGLVADAAADGKSLLLPPPPKTPQNDMVGSIRCVYLEQKYWNKS